MALATAIGLGVDESYAVAVARPVSLSYFDHPPLAFWITAAAEHLFGSRHDLLLRLPFILLFAATTWMLYRLTALLFDGRAGLFAAILVSVIPVFGVSDGGWILPDGPLLFGTVGASLCLAHAVNSPDRSARGWWLVGGLFTGVALVSKYHAVLFGAGVLVYLSTSKLDRHWLRRGEPYLAVLVASIIALPVIVWNARHAWISFRFQFGRADVVHGMHASAMVQNLAGQAGYLLPWCWLPLAWLFISAARQGPADRPRWLLVCLGGGPIVVFTLLSLGGRPGLPHWPAPGWLIVVPMLGAALVRLETRSARLVRAYLAGSAAVVVTLIVVAASQIATGWASRRFPAWFDRGDPSLDALDWREAASAIDASARSTASDVVIAADWIDGAKLGASLADSRSVLCFNDDARHFRFIADQRAFVGRSALIVLRDEPRSVGARARLAAYFESLDSIKTIPIHRHGVVAVRLIVYRGRTLLRPYAAASNP